jgi:hypothetical protein
MNIFIQRLDRCSVSQRSLHMCAPTDDLAHADGSAIARCSRSDRAASKSPPTSATSTGDSNAVALSRDPRR